MNTKFIFLVFFIGINCFSQEKPDVLTIVNTIKSDLDYEFIAPILYDKKEQGSFNFEDFKMEKSDVKNKFYDVFYNAKNEIVKISKYNKKGCSYLDNYDLLIKSYPTYIIYTKCYFKSKERSYKAALVDAGFYLYDKLNKTNYYFQFEDYTYESLVFETDKGEILFESITLNNDFNFKNITSIFLLDENLYRVKEIKWFKGGLEFFYEYSFNKEKKEVETKISFYTSYRCDKEILIKNLKIGNLSFFFETAPTCAPAYILNKKEEHNFLENIW